MTYPHAILAQVDYTMRLQGLKNAFHPNENEPPDLISFFGFAVAVIATVGTFMLVRAIWRRKSGVGVSSRPFRLFTLALKKLGVRLPDRILLRLAARQCGLRHPVLILFSPELLERYAGEWADSIALRPLQAYARRRVDALTGVAFTAEPATDAPAA
jgi:hypothetical protein